METDTRACGEQHGQPGGPAAGRTLHGEQASGVRPGLLIALAALAIGLPAAYFFYFHPVPGTPAAVQTGPLGAAVPRLPRYADFSAEPASPDARFIANWVADSGDNRSLPFVIIDKKNTRVYVFNASGKLLGATPVLLGAAVGDDSVPDIGKRPLSEVSPEERTTPAGRFIGEPGRNLTGEDVVWVDYDAAVSMHRVRTGNAKEHRLERLASPTIDDNRISFGCVNMPVAFYENVLSPVFKVSYGVVYVLPEVKPVGEVFAAAYDPAVRHRISGRLRRADAPGGGGA
ncbi:MAG: hypothetical protein JWR68_1502 [Polaromonas sp.]|nr:hypothetical protein [Polaromonas sp.]